jgi:hypothetical protein
MMWLEEKWERIKEIWLRIEFRTEEESGPRQVMLVIGMVGKEGMLGDDVSRLRNGE